MSSAIQRAESIADLRRLADRRLPRAVFDFIDGGAEDEVTLRLNRAQFESLGLIHRVAVDVSRLTTQTQVLGRKLSAPIVISPTGLAGLARPKAETALARAAAGAGVPFTMSCVATVSIEELARDAPGENWFQLYIFRDRGLSHSLMARAADAGFSVLVLTLDCAVSGKRERDPRNGLTIPLRPNLRNIVNVATKPGWLLDLALHGPPRPENMLGAAGATTDGQALTAYMQSQLDPSVTWRDVEWVRRNWKGPLVLKGLNTPEDAVCALDVGADGVVISTHGGRQLDGAIPVTYTLPAIRDAVGAGLTLFCDSGFRRGADILKACALGADAVFLGRAPLYGAAAGGEAGAARALAILREEIERTMALMGATSLGDLTPSSVVRLAAAQAPSTRIGELAPYMSAAE